MLARFFWTCIIFITLAAAGYVYWAVRDLPPVSTVVEEGVNPSKWTQVFGNNDTPILSYGKFHHKQVPLKEISPHFIESLIATEDRRFYNHFGIDPLSIARAIFIDLTQGRLAEGGSTLTQQLARNVFLSNERSLKRKVREAFLSIKLEQQLSKEDILELYVNNIYFGEGAYGIHAASEIYFNKKPSQLTIDEAALLAGMPQAPSRYNPFLNPEKAKSRRNEVLANLYEVKKLNEQELKALQAKNFRLNPAGREISTANRAPYFNQFVQNQVQELFELDEQGFWQSGLKIYTTVDPYAQSLAARSVRNQSKLYGRKKANEQAALISINPKTGGILAYVGGTNYGQTQFDRVSSAVRSPGSLFKIFTYTTAIENGYAPSRVYLDEPIKAGEWRPQNYDKKHHGYMTLAQALAKSNNIVAVKVLQELSPKEVIHTAQKMGINAKLENNLSLTLGSSGVTLFDLTSAIGVLANGGVQLEPYAIEKILDREGNVVYEHYPMKSHVLDRETTDTMVAMMQGVVERGTGQGANIGRPVAGKTGTSDDNRDGWFIGFTPDIVTGVWVGNDDNSPAKGITGGGLPANIWTTFMRPYVAKKVIAHFNLEYAKPLNENDYTDYNLENISPYEKESPLALDQRTLPVAGSEATLEIDPRFDHGPIPEPDPNTLHAGSSNPYAPRYPAGPPIPWQPQQGGQQPPQNNYPTQYGRPSHPKANAPGSRRPTYPTYPAYPPNQNSTTTPTPPSQQRMGSDPYSH